MLPMGIHKPSSFLLALGVTILVCLPLWRRMVVREGVSLVRLLTLFVVVSVFAIAGAKTFSWLQRAGEMAGTWGAELDRGWRYPGALMGLVGGVWLFKARLLPEISLARLGDVLAPIMAIGAGTMRVGCLIEGCCTGRVCALAICVRYPPESATWYWHARQGWIPSPEVWTNPVLPLSVLLMLWSLAVGVFLLRCDSHRRYDGQIFLLFLAVHEGGKFMLELFRAPSSLALQLGAALPCVVGILALVWRVRIGSNLPRTFAAESR